MDHPDGFVDISLPGSTLWFIRHPNLGSSPDDLFATLKEEIPWEQKMLSIRGMQIPEPRLISWHGNPGCSYTYARRRHEAKTWTPTLSQLRDRLNDMLATQFNSVLCNLYRNGRDSIGKHSDNESELGERPIIASLNLGGERVMKFRSVDPHGSRTDLLLTHGSLLVMAGDTQQNYTHQIDKVNEADPRINLTFRTIYSNKGNRP